MSYMRPALERLEARRVPSLTIDLDYRFDTGGLTAGEKAVIGQAALLVGNQIEGPAPAIVPSGDNTWTINLTDPSSEVTVSVPNPTIALGHLLVFVGGRAFSGGTLGLGGPGGEIATGDTSWLGLVGSRNWGGSISIDTATNWSTVGTAGLPAANQFDLLSVAVHELGHVLGIGTAAAWFADVSVPPAPLWLVASSSASFTGANAVASYGGPVPLEFGGAHWSQMDVSFGDSPSLASAIGPGVRKLYTDLDWSALRDIGWQEEPLPVAGWYQTFLGRPATYAESVYWSQRLRSGQTQEAVLADFLASPEFIGRFSSPASLVQGFYELLLNREPDPEGLAFWLSQAGDPRAVVAGFLASAEYRSLQVAGLYQALLHRTPATGEISFWVGTGLDLFGIRLAFERSDEFLSLT